MNLLIVDLVFLASLLALLCTWPCFVPSQAGLVLHGILLMTVSQILTWL